MLTRQIMGRLLLALLTGGCQSPFATTSSHQQEAAAPQLNSSKSFTLSFGDTQVVVEPLGGGRITHLRHKDTELLVDSSIVSRGDSAAQNQFGSTFWISPQDLWNWPPETAIDSDPYRVVGSAPDLILQGEPAAITGLAVTKRFSPGADHLRIEYTLRNAEKQSRSAAPWEVTRVSKGGLAFFPAQEPSTENSTLASQLREGVAWLDLSGNFGHDVKLFQQGQEGWLAYAWQGLVLIKSFPDISADAQAPGEAEIEIYVNGPFDYVELEQQGAYREIAPGQTAKPWAVEWRVRTLPPELSVELGNGQLVQWVRGQLTMGD